VTLAHSAVRQGRMAIITAMVLTLAGTSWWLIHTTAIKFSRTARSGRQVVQLGASITSYSMRVRAAVRDAAVSNELDQWLRDVKVARQQLDTVTLAIINGRLSKLVAQLNEAYEVRVVSDPEPASRLVRMLVDEQRKTSGYYLIVSARNAQDQTVPRAIPGVVTNESTLVDYWAEQVPKEVYDRVMQNRDSDGNLNETLFAVKRRGFRDEDIRLHGPDGKPLARRAQIAAR
jgi:hypothetical protein